ncbi:MAG: restriction endonuclease subunit S [Candidatus Methanoperedens sp.]|uniref:restriction endonuclease subunit S n=1 Tax=Candidatus Methanoperedens sp. BLZ2 TaxID=2035255 RepID=UPI001305D228|nr:restriction endonuclease subunit S [Candidatus Methanoperedens sp. BLZ2]KAB2946961.1 MAG: hypothetical protein F9K14_05865 [Candidatus Methanoperedens sp.]MBZ0176762.1 restriction endonuclease subunit S [Candidatus Methanoperedens nitroreducens]MCX9080483.1 restriction endonuclease subunit S [Candidatus Methanoperedens sp.]
MNGNSFVNTNSWKPFRYDELFYIQKGKRIINRDTQPGTTPCIRPIDSNNGVDRYIDIKPNHSENTITVNYNGSSVAETFYQPIPYFALDDVNILYPKNNFRLNMFIAMFLITLIRKEKYRFNYGRKWKLERMNESIIKLPVKENGEPDIEFMEKYIKSLMSSTKPISNKNLICTKIELDVSQWKYHKLSDLFEITGSKRTPLRTLEGSYGKGKYPYVTTQATNNGVGGFYDFKANDGNILTVDSAVIGYCSYQPLDFSASDHVEKLIPRFKLNKYNAMFLTTVINSEKYRYNYGRKASQDRMSKTQIKLPTKTDGTPDFDFMENYIKSLPYSSSL